MARTHFLLYLVASGLKLYLLTAVPFLYFVATCTLLLLSFKVSR